jgi:hypothetical protein
MAKKKKSKSVRKLDQAAGSGVSMSSYFESILDGARVRAKGWDGSYVSGLAQKAMVGLPLPYLSQRIMFQSTVVPLGRVIHLKGPTETLKSLFSFFLMSLAVRMHRGVAKYDLTEPRDQEVLRNSLVGKHLLTPGKKFLMNPCGSVEDWQRASTRLIEWLRKAFKKAGGMDFPMVNVVDSLVGALSESTIADIFDEGHASVNFSKESNIISTFVKFVFNQLMPWPVIWVATNHQKSSPNKQGYPVWRTLGGEEIRFYLTYEFEFRRQKDYKGATTEDKDRGRRILIRTTKNSLGDTRIELEVDVWWYNDVNGEQHTYFDWPAASIDYLHNLYDIDAKDSWRKRIAEVIDLDVDKKRVSSSTLKLKNVSFAEAGHALEAETAICHELHKIFGVVYGRPFIPGIPYVTQLEAANANTPLEELMAGRTWEDCLEPDPSEVPNDAVSDDDTADDDTSGSEEAVAGESAAPPAEDDDEDTIDPADLLEGDGVEGTDLVT